MKLIVFLFLLISSICATAQEILLEEWKVTYVVDGDTFYAENESNGRTKFRLIGIDAPESKHPQKPVEPYSHEAHEYLIELIDQKSVWLEFDVQKLDRYGRSLVYVYDKDKDFINANLVENGLAVVSTFPPNVKYVEIFIAKQKEARENKVGIWSSN